jgi:hypothetical protein
MSASSFNDHRPTVWYVLAPSQRLATYAAQEFRQILSDCETSSREFKAWTWLDARDVHAICSPATVRVLYVDSPRPFACLDQAYKRENWARAMEVLEAEMTKNRSKDHWYVRLVLP